MVMQEVVAVYLCVPREIRPGERRVALTPDIVGQLIKKGHKVGIETGAGLDAQMPDEFYVKAGAEILPDAKSVYQNADVLLKIRAPEASELALLKPGTVVVAMLAPLAEPQVAKDLAAAKVTSFSLDLMPRTTFAQNMDVLSSMSTVAGYRAVLASALLAERFFPMLMTAAGTIAPAKALVLGAGVAGLQAIATAKRLGAVVQAFDVREASREQVESLGASFLSVPVTGGEGEGGYARALAQDEEQRERDALAEPVRKADVVISTAMVPGRKAPVLISREMVEAMHTGSVIIDMAAETGGNCELTKPGERIVAANGVIIDGTLNLPATMPQPASQLYSKNLQTFLNHMFSTWVKETEKPADLGPVPDEEVLKGTCVTFNGEVVHAATRDRLKAN